MVFDKINNELLNSFLENVSDPFLVLDGNGNIVLSNKSAKRALDIKGRENIYDLLGNDSSESFGQLIQKVIGDRGQEKVQLILKLNSGEELNAQVLLNSYNADEGILLFCTIKLQSYIISTGDITNIRVNNEVNKVVHNPKAIRIIDEIKSSYPFTFTSKEKIRKLIDGIEELFWIKNIDGTYILANNKVASTLGLSRNQVEGKNENSFIPTYLINFHLLIDHYVAESSNCIVVEGIRLNGFSDSGKYQTVEIPLLDSENKTAAIICIGQKIKEEEKIVLQQDFDPEDKKLILKGEMFEKLFQVNPLPIFIVEKESLKFIEINHAAAELYGYKKEEFLNKDLTDLYSEEDIQTLLDSSVENLKEGIFYGPYKHKKKDDSALFIEISKISAKYKDKNVNLCIVNEVTEKVRSEINAQVYKAAFENLSDPLFMTDSSGFITFINEAVSSRFGYSKDELKNTSFPALLKDENRGDINNKIFKSDPIDQLDFNTALKNSEGNFINADVKAVPVFNHKKEIESFTILARLEGVKMQSESVSTDDIVSVELNQTSLSNIFHDILTPVNVIIGFARELMENKEDMSAEQKEMLDMINQNRAALLNVMNSVAEYANFENENIELKIEEIKITDIIESLHSEFNEIRGANKVEFAYGKISSSIKFSSDKPKFHNLISSLLKIGILIDKESKIYLSAYPVNENSFAIVIKDNYGFTSKGMLENYKAIFDGGNPKTKDFKIPKYYVDLAKKLIDLLHCETLILSANNGSEFAFVFPIDFYSYSKSDNLIPQESEPAEANDSTETFSSPEINFENKNISSADAKEEKQAEPDVLVEESPVEEIDLSALSCLYIEDQIDSQIFFKVQMKELKKIKFALSFENAVPMLEKEPFDFIVMDINLQGDYNGLDALKIIHQSPGFEKIPIIAVSAYVADSEKEKFIAAGFTDFIAKPLFNDKLRAALSKIY